MSKDMKLIMENWRSNVINEKIDQCGEATVGDVIKVFQALQQEKTAQAKKERIVDLGSELAGWGLALAGLIGELGLGGAIAGTAAGPIGAAAGIIGAVVIGAVRAKRGKKGAKERMDMILKTLCIDPKLVDILDDDIEEDFMKDQSFSSRLKDVEQLAKTNPNAPMPNFNAELTAYIEQKYLNRNKPKKQTDIDDIATSKK